MAAPPGTRSSGATIYRENKPNKVYIGNLPKHTSQEDLQSCFGKIGNIISIELRPWYGFVEFDSCEAAEESVAKYNEGFFMGNKIRVSIYRPKNSGDPDACFKCGQMGHWASKCPNLVVQCHSRPGEVAQLELERRLSATLVEPTERDQRLAQLTDELRAQTSLVEQRDSELVDMRKKLDELLLSRDQQVRALEQADERSRRARERYETELAEVRVELGERKSELEAVRLRLTDAEDGWAKSKSEADTLRAQTMAGLISTDEDRLTRGLVERIRAVEAEMASLRLSEKSSEEMQCRNEG